MSNTTPENIDKTTNLLPPSVGRLVNLWKRFFDDWAHQELELRGYPYFKMAYMPFIMNISNEGSTNNEIAQKAKVTKQAMSKVVKELTTLGLIRVEKHPTDARATMIYLSDAGEKFVAQSKLCVTGLHAQYKEILGEEELNQLLHSMQKIVQHHETITQNKTLKL